MEIFVVIERVFGFMDDIVFKWNSYIDISFFYIDFVFCVICLFWSRKFVSVVCVLFIVEFRVVVYFIYVFYKVYKYFKWWKYSIMFFFIFYCLICLFFL